MVLRPTYAEIDLNAIRHNLKGIRKKTNNRKILIAVKADAYGHGAVPVSRMAEAEQLAEILGVATVSEAVQLRDAGIRLPILILGHILPEEAETVVQQDIMQAVADRPLIEALQAQASAQNKTAHVHLKVDTGMGRLGVFPDEVVALARFIYEQPNLKLEGIMTHFPVSDAEDKTFTYQQVEAMNQLRTTLHDLQLAPPLFHAANSGAILDIPEAYFDMVRPGVMIYGTYPSHEVSHSIELHEAMTWKTKIVFLKQVHQGTTLSYGRTYSVPRENSLVATLPVGYADGYNRLLSNRAPVLFGGQRYRISGRVCMDQCLVDLGPNVQAKVGDEIVLFGRQGQGFISIQEIADLLQTITYEITCWVSKRVPRVYTG